jgi:hypothetical protein
LSGREFCSLEFRGLAVESFQGAITIKNIPLSLRPFTLRRPQPKSAAVPFLLATMFLLLKSIFWMILLRFEFLAIRRRDRGKSRKLAWFWSTLVTQFTVLLSVWYFMGRTDYVTGQ